MPYESLQAIVGTAVIDANFRKALLNGSRRRVISKFKLTREEVKAVMSIHADTLEQFAEQLDKWISKSKGRLEPPPLTVPLNRLQSAWARY